MTQPTSATGLCIVAVLVLAVGCGKKEEPAPKAAVPVAAAPATHAPAAAAPAAEVKKLVEDTRRYAESIKAQPAGDGASAEQLAKLPGLLEQLLRHMEERAQTSQQGGDVAKPEAQVAEDLKQLQEVQSALPAPAGDQQGTPASAGQEKTPVERISENLAKITLMAQQGKDLVAQGKELAAQGKELAASVRPPKDQLGASASSEGTSIQGTGGTQAPAPAEGSAQTSNVAESKTQNKVVLAAPPAASACCTVVLNPALVGRLGRLVVAFPEGVKVDATIDVYLADNTHAKRGYGNFDFALLPGNYSVVVSGKRADNVTIRSGHDTKVKVGVLRVNAPSGTTVDVMDQDRKTHLKRLYGTKEIGFLIGTVHVQVAGQMEAVTIQEGKVTDF